MGRMTEKDEAGVYRVDAEEVVSRGKYCHGPAIEKLAAYENMHEAMELRYQQTADKLESLKQQGKSNTSTARQLVAQKLTFSSMLNLYDLHDVGE